MKSTAALFAILLTVLTSSLAQAQSLTSDLGSLSEDGNAPVTALMDNDVGRMAGELCRTLAVQRVSDNFLASEELQKKLLFYSKIDNDAQDAKVKLAKFFNYYSPRMMCPASNGMYPPQHVFQRALALNIQAEVFKFFLQHPEEFPIDVNVITYAGSKPLTLLDYIDDMLAIPNSERRFNLGQVRGVKRVVTDYFGGKRVAEMSDEEIEARLGRVELE